MTRADHRIVLSRAAHAVTLLAAAHCIAHGALAASNSPGDSARADAATLTFGGTVYLHRWSKNGQNEFTPSNDTDLDRWRDMVTINVNEAVRNGDQLAVLANSILANYQKHGKIVRTDSKPRTPQRPAEHLIVAILGNATLLEAVFARIVLTDGVGMVAVYSHRVYGAEAAGPIGEWMQTNGPVIEKNLMTWDKIPAPAALKRLPQSS